MTSTPTRPFTRRPPEGDQRIVLRGIPWVLYEALTEALGDQAIRVAYDRGVLEIMSPSPLHERYKKLMARLVEDLLVGLRIPFEAAGESRWTREAAQRGLEADECYYLDAGKLAHVQGRAPDLPDDPVPDLAIEIDLSPEATDRAGIYAALGIPEVWRFDGEQLRIGRPRLDGAYEERPDSRFLPIRADEVPGWIQRAESMDLMTWSEQLRGWIRDELAPRLLR